MFQITIKSIAVTVLCLSIILTELSNCMSVPDRDERKVTSRISGGNPAPMGAFPFQVSLRHTTNTHFCGGALISDRWVLTAASCVYNKLTSQLLIVVGADSIWDGTIYGCENITLHERFDSITLANDIAVVKTNRDVYYTTFVAPTPYYKFSTSCNLAAVTSGWGDTETGTAFTLQYLNVTTITNLGCQMFLSNYEPANEFAFSTSTAQQICAFGTFNTGSSICNSDKGGPLFRPSSRVITGIMSFSTCVEKIPAVFTAVGYYEAWIEAATNVTGSTLN